MSVALKFQTLVRRPVVSSSTIAAATGLRRTAPWLRSYSSAVGDTLPLSGIKVLDMTRVLAGVSSSLTLLFRLVQLPFSMLTFVLSASHTVRRSWEI